MGTFLLFCHNSNIPIPNTDMMLRCSSRINVVGRRFLSTTEKTTDEKAAELSRDAWPSVKKYAFLIVPSALFVVLSVDIVNNLYHRKKVEELLPSYVNIVRKYYGFKDEDAAEIARIKFVSSCHKHPVDVVVELSGSNDRNALHTIELVGVSGDLSTTQLDSLIREKLGTETNYGGLRRVSFKDAIVPNSSQSDRNDLLSSDVDVGGGMVQVVGLSPWIRSLWNERARSDLKVVRSHHMRLNQPSRPVSREVVNMKFDNWACDAFEGLQTYKEFGNGRLAIKDDDVPKRRVKRSSSRAISIKSSPPAAAHEKQFALEAIKRVEFQIKELENEKRVGKREIDDIEQDILHKRREIADIRRKHLNYFYYF